MSRPDFRYFAIFGTMRTGSNLLDRLINQYGGLSCHGELFNPHFIGTAEQTDFKGIDLATRESAPLSLIDRMIAESDGKLPGFRIFQGHDPRVETHAITDPHCAKIILRRAPLDSFVSLQIARETDQWILGNATSRKTAKIRFDPEAYGDYLAALNEYYDRIRRGIQAAGQAAFDIRYEDLKNPDVMNGLAGFLGRAEDLRSFAEPIKRQNPEPLSEKVENFDEMIAAIGSETGNITAPRGGGGTASVKDLIASTQHPILFAPIPGTARNPIMAWLKSLDGDIARGMTQSALSAWLDRSPGLTAMAVTEHPLTRAYRVFQKRIYGGGDQVYQVIRDRLVAHYGLVLADGPASPEDTAAAFTTFLEFLKVNLAGQTSLRIDAEWDYQTRYLEAMAAHIPLTDIIRDRDFPAVSAILARRHGFDLPKAGIASHGGGQPLSKLVTPSMEKLCRKIYARDYRKLGFGDWADP